MRLARTSTHPHELSGRCSVFCKSDCTHALNKGEPIADVTAGLARMIAKKIEELLVRINARSGDDRRRNGAQRRGHRLSQGRASTVDVPPEAPYFEALGAALWALKTRQDRLPAAGLYYRDAGSSFEFHKPISDFTSMVDFKEMPFEEAAARRRVRPGAGRRVHHHQGRAHARRATRRSSPRSTCAPTATPSRHRATATRSFAEQLGGTRRRHRRRSASPAAAGTSRGCTPSPTASSTRSSPTPRAAAHFDPEVDTIFEIGGQDAKYTYLTNAVASDYAMNEACSAGTGTFLEESA